MNKIDEIIKGIPDNKMSDAYVQQKVRLEEQLALNATAYRLQESNTILTEDQKKELLKEIEENLNKEISKLAISKSDYRFTKDISDAKANNWQALMKEAAQEEKGRKKRKFKR